MKEEHVVPFFDGRPVVTIPWFGFDPDGIPRTVDIGYEFGYRLTGVQHLRTSVRLEFERDDRPEARARASWAVGYHRIHGVVGKPRPLIPLPPHLGPRIEPMEAARERYHQKFLKDTWGAWWTFAVLAAMLVALGWQQFRSHLVILIPFLYAVVSLAVWGFLRPFVTTERQRRGLRTIEMYEFQQSIERGFVPPPPPTPPGGNTS